MKTNLLSTRTFWVGVTAILAALVTAVFGSDETLVHLDVLQMGRNLVSDPKFFVGLAAITGRAALIDGLRSIFSSITGGSK